MVRDTQPEEDEVDDSMPVITLGDEQMSTYWEAVYDDSSDVYRVSGEKIEKFARRTNYDQFESVNRLRDIMKKLGITHELIRQGASGESLVQIGESQEFTLVEQ